MTKKEIIYGVNLQKPVTALMARDALVKCFNEAHCNDAELETKDPAVTEGYITNIIKKAFEDSGGDFDKPTKQSIVGAMEELKKFAANFRDSSIIKKHAERMTKIVKKIS